MERVSESVPGGSELLGMFKGTRSKRIFIYESRRSRLPTRGEHEFIQH
jgi:hypothetical protein